MVFDTGGARLTFAAVALAALLASVAAADPIQKGVGNPGAITGKVGPTAKPAAEKETPPVKENPAKEAERKREEQKKGKAAADKAVAALIKQFQGHLTDPTETSIQKTSDWFLVNPDPAITQEAILDALKGKLAIKLTPPKETPPLTTQQMEFKKLAAEGYVKWQLLSGIPGKFDKANVNEAANIYKSIATVAPLIPRPGMSPQDRANWENLMRRAGPNDVAGFNKMITDTNAEVKEANYYMVEFRNEFYARLPSAPDTFKLGLDDAFQRTQIGADHSKLLSAVSQGIRNWAYGGDAPASEINLFLQAIAKAKLMKSPPFYNAVAADDKTKRLKLTEGNDALDSTVLTTLATDLEKVKKGGGPHFKEE